MAKAKTHVFAIVRIDEQFASVSSSLRDIITVKEIVWTLEKAEAEVAQLNGSKGCKYFWQTTRVIAVDEQAEPRESI